ncbi:MAG: UDP-N-acetylglucosamine--N-acetylmuramyl-(pentapeptide) pyrophosphoryl-undecaprenol N-acetylglucosamine transferase [Actinobacteria bacterium]|nr:UDP-N-acetylglucosamine--N-acetylmuramyl-(pentapeptide) pyrophosphoryl-undecaprenol N-acetylglucosamine transferase [Actinomycetota bacterium]
MHDRSRLACLIAAGGTAGHVLPALAVAESLRRNGVHVTFAGSPERVEARLVPESGFEFDSFRVSGLPRRPGPTQLRALMRSASAPAACLRILANRRPDVVFGGGGFVAGPMVLAAWLRRIPAALSEADAHLGLANRLALPFARRVFLAYPIQTGPRVRVVGRPIPERSRPVGRAEARRELGLPEEGQVLLVSGALAGARALNELAVGAWGCSGPTVLHLSGERDFELLRGRVDRPGYRLLPSVERFGSALSAADLVLARAGGSVWEIAAAGRPAILVPYPYATGDHQTSNARHFASAGGALLVPETEVERVPGLVRELLADGPRLAAMSAAMLRAARPDAADEIARELIDLATA